jgi:hypothetical protein
MGESVLVSLRFTVTVSLFVMSLSLSVFPYALAADYDYSYWVLDHPDSYDRYELNVSVSSSLHDYYVDKDHTLRSELDMGKFVTPYAVEPIADALWTLYDDDEDFANGALMIVHQIPYEASAPQKYPVETIVANEGDCDLFSFIAASVMVAGGLDVILLFYDSEDHMNIGVNLSHAPEDARMSATYFTYDGERYYMAETTGGAWETGWRVGECPESFEGVSAQIITLEDAETVSPGQVSASFGPLTGSSTITLSVSSSFLIEGNSIMLSGVVAPASVDGIVTIYARSEDSAWIILETMSCGLNGRYSYEWKPESAEVYYVRASWSGDSTHASADSNVSSVRVMSSSLVMLGIMMIVLATVAVVVYAVSKRVGKVNEYPIPQ